MQTVSSGTLEIWSNHFCPSMGLNGESVAIWTLYNVYGPSFYLPALRSPVHVVPPQYGMYSQTLRYTNVDKQRFSLCASRVSRHCTLSGSLDCIIADPPRFLNLVHCGRGGGGIPPWDTSESKDAVQCSYDDRTSTVDLNFESSKL
jgi:hypothetical protein